MMHGIFYIGVVEDRKDPLKLGRCKVRIFGVHDQDKRNISTDDLPWAVPVMPITGAALSGIGHSPTGPVEGTFVIIMFQDGPSKQMPIMFGVIPGIPQSKKFFDNEFNENQIAFFDSAEESNPLANAPANALKDKDGRPIVDGSGKPITVGEAVPSVAALNEMNKNLTATTTPPSTVPGWYLGKTSEKFESGGRGPGVINDYLGKAQGDPGGASYGVYQIASFLPETFEVNGQVKTRKKGISTLDSYLKESRFVSFFSGQKPGTTEFDATWKSLASKNEKEFRDDQHDFIERTIYNPAVNKLKSSGFDVSKYGPAVRDLIWSTAVQFGPGKVVSVFEPVIGKTSLTEIQVIEQVSDFKINGVDKFFASSADNIKNGVKNRYKQEKALLLELASKYSIAAETAKDATPDTPQKGEEPLSTVAPKDFDLAKANAQVISAAELGFVDPNQVYPKNLNEPDTSRLARNNAIDKTCVKKKEDKRKKDVFNGVDPKWSEPLSPYAAQYPFNHVYETESGHVMEFDDTANAERIHTYHKSGTYTEIDRNGRQVNRIVGDSYTIVDRNGYICIQGTTNVTLEGNVNLNVLGSLLTLVVDDSVINFHNDCVISVAGNAQVSAGEILAIKADKITIESEGDIDIVSAGSFNVKSGGAMNHLSGNAMNFQSSGVMNHLSSNNINMQASGQFNAKSGGNLNLDGAAIYENSGRAGSAGSATSAQVVQVKQLQRVEADITNYPNLESSSRSAAAEFELEFGDQQMEFAAMVGIIPEDRIQTKPIEVGNKDMEQPKKPSDVLKGDCAQIAMLDSFPDTFQLSPNFTLGKIALKAPVVNAKLDDQYGLTKQEIVCNLQALALNILEPIKRKFPNLIVTNTLRNNLSAGGKVSQHNLGEAADLQFSGASKAEYFKIAQQIKEMNLPFDQLLLEYKTYGTGMPWIHISYSRAKGVSQRYQILTLFNDKTHSQGLVDLA